MNDLTPRQKRLVAKTKAALNVRDTAVHTFTGAGLSRSEYSGLYNSLIVLASTLTALGRDDDAKDARLAAEEVNDLYAELSRDEDNSDSRDLPTVTRQLTRKSFVARQINDLLIQISHI